MDKGIDYGLGLTNIDAKTGIRYGVIHQHEVLQAWADSSEPYFPCEECEHKDNNDGCDECMDCEPLEYTYDDDGYICQQSADDPDIFVIKSPFYTYCQFCSPCAPGAGYLMNYFKSNALSSNGKISSINGYKRAAENAGFIRAYCFGHDWFDEGKAPYPVFDVKTDMEVKPS